MLFKALIGVYTTIYKAGNNVLSYWGVEDIDKEYQRLIGLGAKEYTPIADVGGAAFALARWLTHSGM